MIINKGIKMQLTMFKKGSKVKIKSINSDLNTKKRIKSFGINIGSEVIVEQFSVGSKNIEIKSPQGLVALRKCEADEILCEEVK